MGLPGYLAGQLRSVSGSSVAVERLARGGQEEPGEGEAYTGSVGASGSAGEQPTEATDPYDDLDTLMSMGSDDDGEGREEEGREGMAGALGMDRFLGLLPQPVAPPAVPGNISASGAAQRRQSREESPVVRIGSHGASMRMPPASASRSYVSPDRMQRGIIHSLASAESFSDEPERAAIAGAREAAASSSSSCTSSTASSTTGSSGWILPASRVGRGSSPAPVGSASVTHSPQQVRREHDPDLGHGAPLAGVEEGRRTRASRASVLGSMHESGQRAASRRIRTARRAGRPRVARGAGDGDGTMARAGARAAARTAGNTAGRAVGSGRTRRSARSAPRLEDLESGVLEEQSRGLQHAH